MSAISLASPTAWSLSGAALLEPWRERARNGQAAPSETPSATRSERQLWAALSQLGAGWMREYSTGRYRLDFFLPSAGLAVEVDGGSHFGPVARASDEVRDLWHAERGIETMRVAAEHVERDAPGVVEEIERRVQLRLGAAAPAFEDARLSYTGELVVEPTEPEAEDLTRASDDAESEIESFAVAAPCETVLPSFLAPTLLTSLRDRLRAVSR
jgi:very-short-patch-repair endonuclease